MAMSTNLNFTQAINCKGISFSDAYSPNTKTLAFESDNDDGSILKRLNVSSSSTSDMLFQVWAYDGSNYFLLGTTNVPDLSGTDNTNPSVDLLNSTQMIGCCILDNTGNYVLPLKAGWDIYVSSTSAASAGKYAYITAIGEDY